jgi:hypothetical protein
VKNAITCILTGVVVVLAFSLVWMNRYVYFKTSGPGVLKVVRINRFTGRYQYSQMRVSRSHLRSIPRDALLPGAVNHAGGAG